MTTGEVTLENWVFDPGSGYAAYVTTGPNMTLEQAKRKCVEDMSHIPESHRHNMEYMAIPERGQKGEMCVIARYCGNPQWKTVGLCEGGFWWTPESA